jgi:hypothetical protein
VAKPSDHTRVTLYWHAIPNGNKARGGWLPVVDEDGKQHGDTWRSSGYDLETALAMAKEDAEKRAERFTGDWDIVVGPKPGAPGVPKEPRKAPKAKKPPPRSSPWGEVDTASDQLPWRNSYSNWTMRLSESAAKHGASIAFGSETYDAWKAGISPDTYAKSRARR